MRTEKVHALMALTMAVIVLLSTSVSFTDADFPSENYSTVPPLTDDPEPSITKLDLRDKGLVTPVKNQGNFGTCWAHAAISCLETNLINKGYADLTIDLSELHLAYYMCNMSADPLGGLEGDTVRSESYLMSGANDMYSTFSMSSWRGAVLEKDVPYEWADEALVLDDKYEYDYTKYVVTDVLWLNAEDRGAIKSVLNDGNSVAMSYYASDKTADNIMTNPDGTKTASYYCPDTTKIANHDVTIIGYDDDYPAENFTYAPPGDGAWLIKNSWGVWTPEKPRIGSDGCIWLSYYTSGLDTFAAYEVEPKDAQGHNYQYDGGGSQHQNITFGNTGYMANVFTCAGAETLRSVSFYNTQNINVDYDVDVYLNPSDVKDPVSGKLVSSADGTMKYAGYHTIDLDTSVSMRAGDVFSVVVTLFDPAGNVYLGVDTSADVYDPYTPDKVWAETRTAAKAGQSFVSSDGDVWDEISDDGISNIRIKAFTVDTPPADYTMIIVVACIAVAALAIASWYFLMHRKNIVG